MISSSRLVRVALLVALAPGCRTVSHPPPIEPDPVPAAPASESAAPEPAEVPLSISEQLVLDAEDAFAAADLLTGAFLLEEALRLPGIESARRAVLRFRIAMLYVDPSSSLHNMERGKEELAAVIDEDPASLAAQHAGVVQLLLTRIETAEDGRQGAEDQVRTLQDEIQAAERDLGMCKQEVERIKQILLQEGSEPGR